MYLSDIKIENFRLFQDFQLKLCPTMNIIVGENNCGKTALIDAIRYTLDTNSSEWVRIQESDFRRGQTEFRIRLRFDRIERRHAHVFVEHLTHEVEAELRKSVLYVTLHAQLTAQHSRGVRIIRTSLTSGKDGEGPSIEREIRNYLSATYLRPLRDANAELTAAKGSRLSQVLNASKSFRLAENRDLILRALVEANRAIIGNDAIGDSLTKITEQLTLLCFSDRQLAPVIEIIGGTDIENMGEVERAQTLKSILEKLRLLMDESDKNQGLGYSNILFMATELLLIKQSDDEFPLLLIEEPEAHLHPQLQMKFLKALRNEFGGPGAPQLQSILTTHSPNLASKAPLKNIILMSCGRAYPLREGETGLAPEDYVFLEKFLDVTKSNLFFAKGLILVEGAGENILLPTIAEILDRSLEDYGVSIVAVGSTGIGRYSNIFLRPGLDDRPDQQLPVKVACLRDMDRWPARAEKRDANDPIGFKLRLQPVDGRGGNLAYWDMTPEGLTTRRTDLRRLNGQNVRVYVSDHWTFEYSLIKAGLAKDVFVAYTGAENGFNALSNDKDERSLQIFGPIETTGGAKTQIAYQLSERLLKTYRPVFESIERESAEAQEARRAAHATRLSDLRTEFQRKLPSYILDAISYVTTDLPVLPDVADAADEERRDA